MGVLYLPFFDVTRVSGLGTITFARGGSPNLVIDLASVVGTAQDDSATSPIFVHRLGTFTSGYIRSGVAAAKHFEHYSRWSFATSLTLAMQAAATSAAWPSPASLTATFSTTTARYTLSYVGLFSATFSSAVTRNLLGFAADQSGSATYVATKTPLYCINSTMRDVSHESAFEEPDGIGNMIMTDDGHGDGTSRSEAPKYKEWVQQYETKLKTFRVLGAQPDNTNDPFTHEHLFEHCRGSWPFILYGVDRGGSYGVAEVYKLRTDGISCKPKRCAPGHDDMFDIPYRVALQGVVDGVIV